MSLNDRPEFLVHSNVADDLPLGALEKVSIRSLLPQELLPGLGAQTSVLES